MTTTINIANIKVGMNVKELKDSGEFARHELARLTKMFKDSETSTQRFENELELLNRAVTQSGGKIKNYEQIVGHLEEKYGIAAEKAKALAAQQEILAHRAKAASLGLERNAEAFSAGQLDKLAKMAESAMTPLQKFAREKKFLDDSMAKGSMETKKYDAILKLLEDQYGITASKAKALAEMEERRQRNIRTAKVGIILDKDKFSDEDLSKLEKLSRAIASPMDELREQKKLLDRARQSGLSEDKYRAMLKHVIDSLGINAEQTKKAAEEQSRLNAILDSAKTSAERFANEEKFINEQLAKGTITTKQHEIAIDSLLRKYNQLPKAGAALARLMSEAGVSKGLANVLSPGPTFQTSATFSPKELSVLKELNAEFNSSDQKQAKFKESLDLIEKALKSGNWSVLQYSQSLDRLSKEYGLVDMGAVDAMMSIRSTYNAERIASQETSGLSNRLGGLSASFINAGKAAASAYINMRRSSGSDVVSSVRNLAVQYAGLYQSINLLKSSVQLAVKMETNAMSFEVLTKSAGKTAILMKELRELSTNTPIPFAEHAAGAKMLLGVNVASTEVKKSLEALSAISLGNQESFSGLVKAFADVNAAGRLTGQEMLQFRNAGFNPLQEIARKTGLSMSELKKRMEDGAISAKMVSDALQSATKAGGLFGGMNDKLKESTQGQFNQMMNNFQQVQIAVGETLGPAILSVTDLLKQMFDPKNPSIFMSILDNFAFGLGSIVSLMQGQEAYNKFMDRVVAQKMRVQQAEKDAADEAKKTANTTMQTQHQMSQAEEKYHQESLERIKREREAYKEKINSIYEDNLKARMTNPYNPDAFEAMKLREDTFGKTRGEQMDAEMAIITMSQTRRINELNTLRQSLKESKDSIAIEERSVQLKKQHVLLNDDQIKQSAELEASFKRQLEEEKAATQHMKGLIAQSGGTPDQIRQAQAEEDRRSQQRMSGLRRSFDEFQSGVFTKASSSLRTAAEELTKKFMPKESIARELAQLDFMRQQNMITQQVFDKQAMELGQQAKDAMGLLPNIAPALKEGSAEAYKFILEQNTKSQERWQIKKLNEEMLKELRTANQQNANAPRLAQAR